MLCSHNLWLQRLTLSLKRLFAFVFVTVSTPALSIAFASFWCRFDESSCPEKVIALDLTFVLFVLRWCLIIVLFLSIVASVAIVITLATLVDQVMNFSGPNLIQVASMMNQMQPAVSARDVFFGDLILF